MATFDPEEQAEQAREKLKADLTRGMAYALAPIVRAVSGCPLPEFADDPFGTIRTVLDDLESLERKPVVSTGVMEKDDA